MVRIDEVEDAACPAGDHASSAGERLDHDVTEGALESTRRERDQLQSEMLRLQMDLNRLGVNDDDDIKFPSRGANAA